MRVTNQETTCNSLRGDVERIIISHAVGHGALVGQMADALRVAKEALVAAPAARQSATQPRAAGGGLGGGSSD